MRQKDLFEDVPVSPRDVATLLHCAINYAVGRRSYITFTVAEIVRRYWSALTPSEQQTLIRNLRSDLDHFDRREEYAGDACDDQSWRDLLAWMVAETKEGA